MVASGLKERRGRSARENEEALMLGDRSRGAHRPAEQSVH